MKIRLLHISDLHMVSKIEAEAAAKSKQNLVNDSMLAFIGKEGIAADLIVATGDLAFSGEPAQYDECARFFDELLETTGTDRRHLFLVPGNHDVHRKQVSKGQIKTIYRFETEDDLGEIFADPEIFGLLTKKFENFNRFSEQAMERKPSGEKGGWYFETLEFQSDANGAGHGGRVQMAGLNSCLFAGYDEDDRQGLALGLPQTSSATKKIDDSALAIAFFHHPFSCCHPSDATCENMLVDKFDLILHGHLHDPANAQIASQAGDCAIIGAGATFQGRRDPNTFNLIEIDLESGKGTVAFYKYLPDKNRWARDTDINDRDPEGLFRFTVEKLAKKAGKALSDNDKGGGGDGDAQERPPVSKPAETVSASVSRFLRENYLNRVMCDARLLTLEGVDRKAAGCSEDAVLDLNAVYTALKTESSEEFDPEDMDEAGPDPTGKRGEKARVSALAFVDGHRTTALLGDPGSGKTTFVKFLAMCMAAELLGKRGAGLDLLTRPLPDENGEDSKDRQPWGRGALVPVRIELKEFAAQVDPAEKGCASMLWRYVEQDLKSAELGGYFAALKNEFLHPGGILLLDGLDEVPEEKNRRPQIKAAVEDFIKVFPKCHVVVTSRPYAYRNQDWRIPGLSATTLAPFEKGQIVRFVDRWYARYAQMKRLNPKIARGRAELLKQAIFKNERLLELARRPLLLTLMASLHAWRGGSLPEKRQELYSDTVDLLLEWWQEAKIVQKNDGQPELLEPSLSEWLKADKAKIREFINALAFDAHKKQPALVGTAEIKEEKLVAGLYRIGEKSDLDLKKLVQFLSFRAGLLISKGQGIYTFPHRTFQEYLAACHLTDCDFPDTVADLCRKDPDRWRETCLLAGAKAATGAKTNIWQLAAALCYRESDDPEANIEDVWGAQMAARAIVESADPENASERNRILLKRVQNWLRRILEGDELTASERADAGRNLAILGDTRPEVLNIDEMLFCLVPPGPFLSGERGEEKTDESLDYPYWIGKHPVTNAQFDAFEKDGGYQNERYWTEAIGAGVWKDGKIKDRFDEFPREGRIDSGFPFNLSNHPAVQVNWFECLAFAQWLQERWKERFGREFEVRLPLSAEWEKAAKGGMRIPEDAVVSGVESMAELDLDQCALRKNPRPERKFTWGEDEQTDRIVPERTNYRDTGIHATTAVGCFPGGRGPCGNRDMSGNVWEWCMDKIYTSDRVLRGGSWGYDASYCRAAFRYGHVPSSRYRFHGFRLVLLGDRRASA